MLPAEELCWNLSGSSLSPWQRKLVIWSLSLLVAYTVIGFLILPPIIRSVAAKQLAKQLDREVSIKKVKLNPFALSATVDGLLIKDKDGQPFVSWDEVYVNFQLSSFFGQAWVFKEISTTKPFVRAQMNKDGTFNFSDLITKFSTNTPAPRQNHRPSRSCCTLTGCNHRRDASAVADLTTRTPFTRIIGPLDVDAGKFPHRPGQQKSLFLRRHDRRGRTICLERIFFSRSRCVRRANSPSSKISLNKYAPLYQDFVRFEIRDGSIGLHANYRFEFSATNRVAAVTNTAFALRDFKLGEPGASNNIVELPLFGVTGVNADLEARQAEIGSVFASRWKSFPEPRQGQFHQRRRTFQARRHHGQRAGRHFISPALRHQRRRDAAQQHEPVERHDSRRGCHELRAASGRPCEFAPRET